MPYIIDNALPAPLVRQLAAMFYDAFLLLACWIACGFFFIIISKGEPITSGILHYLLQTTMFAVWVMFFVYFWSKQGQTLGMRAWRLVVVDEHGRSLTWRRALLRWLWALITCFIIGIGIWWRFFDTEKRTLYDRLSKTRLYLLQSNPYPLVKKGKKHV
ncbi:MAG: RDD family protein [Cardiobacteriaceae bacterium]|nr:RDD family protein [Cardiobacteriaceae bacterium]